MIDKMKTVTCKRPSGGTRAGTIPTPSSGRSPRARAVRWLADAIAGGTLRPGDAAPTVNELSAASGVARATAEAALAEAERCRLI